MGKEFKKSLIILSFAIVVIVVFIGLSFFDYSQNLEPKRLTGYILVDDKNDNIQEKNLDARLPILEDKPLRLLFFGDMMLDRHVGEKIEQNGIGFLFNNLASTTQGNFFAGYDIVGTNLEGAVTNEGEHYRPDMTYDFSFHPDLIKEVLGYGLNFFSLANNHFRDQGERGIIETRNNLDNLGVNYAGCEDGIAGECSSKIIEINNKKIGLAGFSMVYSKLDDNKISSIIGNLASSTDLVIVNMHWGKEYEHNFDRGQQSIAHGLIDSGVDIIIGHHPHVVQGIEIYNNKTIFYSLGNFIFDQYFSPDTQEGLAVGIILKEDSATYELFPFKSRFSQAEMMNKEEQEEMFNKILSWSDINPEFSEQIKKGKLDIGY